MSFQDITRERSSFWIRIYKNDDNSLSLLTTHKISNIINICFKKLIDLSPTGWRAAKNDNTILWIPENRLDTDVIDNFILWAEEANTHIWLGINKNIADFFVDELDYCIASDWNYDFNTKHRTQVGEAEYQLKYQFPKGLVCEEDRKSYAAILTNALTHCLKFLPIISQDNLMVTTIPAIKDDQQKLSWSTARYITERLNSKFLKATLIRPKMQTKSLSILQKIELWNNTFKSGIVNLSDDVNGNNIIIVDDLYQSGASLWTYAKYLKSLNASMVMGLVAVKSQRDSDNQ